MAVLKNRAKMSTSTTGTGTITLGSAEDGYQTFADAGVANADVVRYVIEDGSSNWEIGTGTYTASGTTLSRTVSESSNSDAAINLSGSATVFIGATAEDILSDVSLQATEALVNGDLVSLNSTGTVSKVSLGGDLSTGSSTEVTTAGNQYILNSTVATNGNGTFVTLYRADSSYPYVVAHTVVGTTITTGTPVVLRSSAQQDASAVIYDASQQKYLAICPFSDASQAFVLSVSGTTITASSSTNLPQAGTGWAGDYDASQNKGVFLYRRSSDSDPYVVAATISGTSVSFNTPALVQNIGYAYVHELSYNSTAQKSVAFYTDDTGNVAYANAIGLSGSTFTIGSAATVATGDKGYSFSIHGQSSVGFIYRNRVSGSSLEAKARVGSISGTTITLGTEVSVCAARSDYNWGFYDSATSQIIFGFEDSNPPEIRPATLSGTTITLGTATTLSTSVSGYLIDKRISKNASGTRLLHFLAYSPQSVNVIALEFSTSNIDDFIGIAGATIAANATGTINTLSHINTGQSSLTIGSKYYLQANGTLGTTVVADKEVGIATSATDLLITYDPTKGVRTPSAETVGSVSGNATLDLTSGNVFNHTPTANTTFVLSNPPASGTAQGFTLALTGANIASGYDLANASYDSVSFSVASQENSPAGLAFNNSGTKMYIVGLTSDSVFQYSLSTAFDVSTASYDSVSFSVSSQDTVPTEVIFNNAGTKMYIVGNANKTIYQYSLSTAFDLSTASYDSVSFSVISQESALYGMNFNNDGTKMYVIGASDYVFQYSLSTAFDLSTASYDSVSFSVTSQDNFPYQVVFNSDGTKMYIVGNGSDTVYQYSLSTAFDVSTASYDSVSFSVSSQDTSPLGIVFNSDGTKMYIVGLSNDAVYQYSTGSSALATIAYPSSVNFAGGTAPDAPANGETDILTFYTSDGGTTYQGFKAGDAMS